MSDAWAMVCEAATGAPVSLGTARAPSLPEWLVVVPLSDADAAALLHGEGVWDAAARAVVILPPPVPDSVYRWQFFRWLVDTYGLTIDDLESALRQRLEGLDLKRALVDLREAATFRRSHPLLGTMAEDMLSLDAAGVDAAFQAMSELS